MERNSSGFSFEAADPHLSPAGTSSFRNLSQANGRGFLQVLSAEMETEPLLDDSLDSVEVGVCTVRCLGSLSDF